MRIEILTIFLTMPLSIAVITFMGLPAKQWYDWAIFIYFIISCIRFFDGDVRVWKKLPEIEKTDIGSQRATAFFLGVSSKFMFIVMAYYVGIPVNFFAFYALALLLDTFWIWNLREMVDPAKDTGGKKLRDVFKDWLWLDAIRALCLVGVVIAMCIFKKYTGILNIDYIVLIGIIICFVMLLLDFAWNSKLYFE